MSSVYNPYASAGITPATTTTTTCKPTYVSITLNQGNSFVLPPGATLVAVSDKDKVQSDCVDTESLEEFQCYIFYYNIQKSPSGGQDPQESIEILGFVIDGVDYNFVPSVIDGGLATSLSDLLADFITGLTSVSLDGIFINPTVSRINNLDNTTRFFCFQTLPSVSNKMQVKIKDTSTGIINPIYLLPLYTWDQLSAVDIELDQIKATCTCGPDYDPTVTTTTEPPPEP